MLSKRKKLLLGIVMGLLVPLSMMSQTVSKVGTLSLIRAIGECTEGKVAVGAFQKKVDAKRGELVKMNN